MALLVVVALALGACAPAAESVERNGDRLTAGDEQAQVFGRTS
jgi:hypothetical protein